LIIAYFELERKTSRKLKLTSEGASRNGGPLHLFEWLRDQLYCVSLYPGTSLFWSIIYAVKDAEPLESTKIRISTHFVIGHFDIVMIFFLNPCLHKLSYVFAFISSSVDGGYYLDCHCLSLLYTDDF
jgi:hypothetical protein